MPDVRGIAAAYGVRVELADLGDWGTAKLLAEYDPDGPVIRINERTLPGALRQAQGDKETAQGDKESAHGDDASNVILSLSNVILSLSKDDSVRGAIDRAIAHELYHHREAIGEVARLADRAARERAADAFAETLTAMVDDRATRDSEA